jgi:hypothetical protein
MWCSLLRWKQNELIGVAMEGLDNPTSLDIPEFESPIITSRYK